MQLQETHEQPGHPTCEVISPDEPNNGGSRHPDPAAEQPADEPSLYLIEATVPGPDYEPTGPRVFLSNLYNVLFLKMRP